MCKNAIGGQNAILSNQGCPLTICVSQFHPPPSALGVIELVKTNKKSQVYIWPIVRIEGATVSKISKFTKILKFQKNLYANLRLLNDYGLIIPIKTNKTAYVCLCYEGGAIST